MPTLQTLKNKWFINFEDSKSLPHSKRVKNCSLKNHTDGNKVSVLHDGSNLMSEFNTLLEKVESSKKPEKYEIWLGAMNLEPVKLLGSKDKHPDVKARLLDLAKRGTKVYYLGGGHKGTDKKSEEFGLELQKYGSYGTGDKRSGVYKGQHQKYYLFFEPNGKVTGQMGSADFFYKNWDTPKHAASNVNRQQKEKVHNVSLKFEGPSTYDLALTFAERWNDLKTSSQTNPEIKEKVNLDFLGESQKSYGSHSVQILRTYGIHPKGETYSFAKKGEFTTWYSYLNAIKKAKKYIYMEDQYLYPFGLPMWVHSANKKTREADIFYQLGLALKRGVDVIFVAPGRNNAIYKGYEIQQRMRGADYLNKIANKSDDNGRFIFSKLRSGDSDIVVHSKLMIVDDEVSLVGSTNVAQIGMSGVSELHAAVVDEKNKFSRDLRSELWGSFTNSDPKDFYDIDKGIERFVECSKKKKGILQDLEIKRSAIESLYTPLWNKFMDPYRGPKFNY